MQIKSIPGPVETLLSPYGAAGFFVADSPQVASATHARDFIQADPETVTAASAWVAVPFGRDVLVAALVLSDIDTDELATMTDDEVRDWALFTVLDLGTGAANMEVLSVAFRNEYRPGARRAVGGTVSQLSCSEHNAARYAGIGARIDAAFGFPTTVRKPARRRPAATSADRSSCPSHRERTGALAGR